MALSNRQTSLLVQQDWTKVYETFKEADFQSYDFETLRKTMIDYLRTYYPEDFNDFTESSEYIALIDLIAFLGQSLAFRTDLNARENFIDTAERRDSVLKLARLLNYVPKRNFASSGLFKVESISTTETLFDSNGTNISNLIISWNDPSNDNWQEQFNTIVNAALVDSQTVGKGGASGVINGISTQEYTIRIPSNVQAAYAFTTEIEGTQMPIEVVSASITGKEFIYEKAPKPDSTFNFLYRNDNLGNSSNNTGFFVYFKQGDLNSVDFNIDSALPNRLVNIDFNNINNNDTWLYQVNADNTIGSEWTKVPAINGINVTYNKSSERDLFQVVTRNEDQISLSFGDGSFANIPQGKFRLYYRQSAGTRYKITPDEIQNIIVPILYVDRTGRNQTLNVSVSLNYTVANSSTRETLASIRQKAPQQYYTQNRMITGEDYNIFPFTAFNNVQKVKATNRTSSGVSRFLDVVDVTGKYSSTSIFSSDGLLYKDEYTKSVNFSYQTANEIFNIIYNTISPILRDRPMQHLHYSKAERFNLQNQSWPTGTGTISANLAWKFESASTNKHIGYITGPDGGSATGYPYISLSAGAGITSVLKNVLVGSIIKFGAGDGKYFNARNQIVTGAVSKDRDRTYIYASVQRIDQTTKQITISETVPTGAIPMEVIPVFKSILSDSLTNEVVTLIKIYKNFALRYDTTINSWALVDASDISTAPYSNEYAGSTAGEALDASWVMRLEYNGTEYSIIHRGLEYYFESEAETKFYFDDTVKVYDSKTGRTLRDEITVLKFNSQADSSSPLAQNLVWDIYKSIVGTDGYRESRRILVTFPDADADGVPDNPDLFDLIVNSSVNKDSKFVFFKKQDSGSGFNDFAPIDYFDVEIFADFATISLNLESYNAGQIFYAYDVDRFYELNITNGIRSLSNVTTNYRARIGRGSLNFQYKHSAPNNRRIDPSPNNIMDLFILTKEYSNDYVAFVTDTSNSLTEPIAPTQDALRSEFNTLENYKALSDTIIFNSAKFKPLFGSLAPDSLRAKFKIVKNSNMNISDSEIKTSVINAINTYFDINNWDFGESFYFSELSAYLHAELSPEISSIIIVPSDTSSSFGNLYQINAEPDEIAISCATVDDIDIISAITASQLNQSRAGV
jgi:hypothetical protein